MSEIVCSPISIYPQNFKPPNLMVWSLWHFIVIFGGFWSQMAIFGQRTQRGRCPVEYRGEFPYVRPSIHTSPTRSLSPSQGGPSQAKTRPWEIKIRSRGSKPGSKRPKSGQGRPKPTSGRPREALGRPQEAQGRP